MAKKGFGLLTLALCLAACDSFNQPLEPWIDEQYESMKKVLDVSVSPQSVAVAPGTSRQFTAEVNARADAPTDVVWSVSGGGGFSVIGPGGMLWVNAFESIGTALTVTATSVFDPSKSASALVVVGTAGPNVTVTFNPAGGTWSSDSTTTNKQRTVNSGVNVDAPSILTKTGLIFVGWYTALSGGTAVPIPCPIPANTTLYAHWQAAVTFNANGGSWGGASTHTVYVDEGGTMSEPAAPGRTGLTFRGWYTAPSGGTAVAFPYTPSVNTTLYAHWQVAVTFNANGGSWGASPNDPTVYVDVGNTMSASPSTPSRTGFTFAGWYTAPSGGTEVTFPYTPSVNITLYARWSTP
jgi:uncharacterized repeat protein (TIGR02543 family)